MYLDALDELVVNKRLIKLLGFEIAIYWAELTYILKQVAKKKTFDEEGFFKLDRDFVERELNLDVEAQLKCEQTLMTLGIMVADPKNVNRISVSVKMMIAYLTDEDIQNFDDFKKYKKCSARKASEIKIAGQTSVLGTVVVETDAKLKNAYLEWIKTMLEAKSCRLTQAGVKNFVETLEKFTESKATRLEIVKIATVEVLRDASWAINRYQQNQQKKGNFAKKSIATDFGDQKVATEINEDIVF